MVISFVLFQQSCDIIFAECSGKCCGSECNSPPPPPEPGFYIGVSVGAGLFVIVLIIVVVLIIRKQRNRGTDDTYLDPTFDNQICKDKEDYNTMPNYYVADLSAHSEESINTNTSQYLEKTWVLNSLKYSVCFQCHKSKESVVQQHFISIMFGFNFIRMSWLLDFLG